MSQAHRLILIIDAIVVATTMLVPSVLSATLASRNISSIQTGILLCSVAIAAVIDGTPLRPLRLFLFTTVAMGIGGAILRPLSDLPYDIHLLPGGALLIALALTIATTISVSRDVLVVRLRLLLGAALVNSVVAIVQHFARDSFYEDAVSEDMRQSVIFRSPGLLGHPILVGTLLSSALLMLLIRPTRDIVPQSGLRRLFVVILVLGVLCTLNLSTIGALVITGTATLLLSLVRHGWRRRYFIAPAILGTLIGLLAIYVRQTGETVTEWVEFGTRIEDFMQSDSRLVREAALEALPRNLAHYPQIAVFGAGAGAEAIDLENDVFRMSVEFPTFDNSYLTLIWASGVFGLLGFLVTVLWPFAISFHRVEPWIPLTLFFLLQIFVYSFLGFSCMTWLAAIVIALPYRKDLLRTVGEGCAAVVDRTGPEGLAQP